MGILSKHAGKGFKVLKKKEKQNKTLELCAMFFGMLAMQNYVLERTLRKVT